MKNIGNRTERVAVVKSGSASGVFATPQVKRLTAALVSLVVAWIVAGSEAFPGTYPFGIAMVSAVGGVGAMLPILAGALFGSARIPINGGVYALLITLLAIARIVLSVWLLSDNLPERMKTHARRQRLLRRMNAMPRNERGEMGNLPVPVRHALLLAGNAEEIMLHENICVRMSLSACTALLCGAWSVVKGGFSYYDLFGALFMLLFTPLVTYFFYAVTERRMRTSPMREVGIYVTGAILTNALQTLFSHGGLSSGAGFLTSPFSAGILFAFSVSVIATEHYGLYRGVLVGICCGMVLDTRFLPMFALSPLICSVLGRYSITLGILSAGVSSAVWAVYCAGFDGIVTVVPPVVISCAILVPLYRCGLVRLPENAFGGAVRRSDTDAELARYARDKTLVKMEKLSVGLSSVSAMLCGMSERLSRPGREELRGICECAFGMYCRGCAIRGKCYTARQSRADSVIEAMVGELSRDGIVSAGVVPTSLAAHCFNIGRILDEINKTAGERIAERSANDRLAITASDLGLAGAIMKTAHDEEAAISKTDTELAGKLRQLLTYRDFSAGSVSVYGRRVKRILVRDVDLTSTRMGGDDIRRLFEKTAGVRLSDPEFTLDGAILSMSLHTVPSFVCLAGRATCAAANACRYRTDEGETEKTIADTDENIEENIGEGGEETEEIRIDVTDVPPEYGSEVCGDSIASFEADGRYYMLISDGMGSGREAALTSGVCASILQCLICSGAGLEEALKLLNNVIRASGRECSATVDVAEIDLMTGEARFIKSGAAPSFVLRDGSIFRLQSKTVPIGILRALDAEAIGFRVTAGDRVIMVSDGAVRSYEEVPWLLDMMVSDEVILHGNAKDAAAKIVREAARRGSSDDITAGVICIGNAG